MLKIGGPAFDDPGEEFIPGRFIKEGVTITSRGCPNHCPWCYVFDREGGRIRELPIRPGWIIQDNNLLACSHKHIDDVFNMLADQNRAITFSGGLEAARLQGWHCELISRLKIKELWFACDSNSALIPLEMARNMLHFPQKKMRCYVMVGYGNESLIEAEKRLKTVYEMGFDPFCQLYRGNDERKYTQDWKDLARKWSRPAAYRTKNLNPGPREHDPFPEKEERK